MSVSHIKSESAFKDFISTNHVSVIKFFAEWCGPCRLISPKVDVLSNTYTAAKFASVNIDELESVAESEDVSTLPAFRIYVKGTMRKVVIGANIDKLRAAVVEVLEIEGLPTEAAPAEAAPVQDTTGEKTDDTKATSNDNVTQAPTASITSASSTQTIIEVSSAQEFTTLIQKPRVFAYFYAPWCGPCKLIGPKIKGLTTKYPNIQFVKVDADEYEQLGEAYEVSSLPTFKFFFNGSVVGSAVGTKVEKIEEQLQALSQK